MDPVTAPQWLYPAAAKLWSRWLPESSLATLRTNGFYSYWSGSKPTDWGVIALNSCLWMTGNKPTENLTDGDPGDQFAYLEQELIAAQSRGQKAYLLAHCPPSALEMQLLFNTRWSELLRKYHTSLEAGFYGHDHLDFLRIVYDKPGYRSSNAKAVGVGYVSPSGTTRPGGPMGGHNPAFRIFHRMNEQSVQLASHETYWCDLAKANRDGKVVFEKEYSTADDQPLESLRVPSPLTAQGWDDLVNRVNTEDEATQMYWRLTSVQAVEPNTTCNTACKKELLCLARYGCDSVIALGHCFISGL